MTRSSFAPSMFRPYVSRTFVATATCSPLASHSQSAR